MEKEMKQITYKNNALKIAKNLSTISKIKRDSSEYTPVLFIKDNDGVHIRAQNNSSTIIYNIDFNDTLDIPVEKLCFYDYLEFYKYLDSLDEPELFYTDDDCILIKKDRKKIKYPVADEETIRNQSKKLKKIESTTSFKLSSETLSGMKKIVGLLGKDDVKINFNIHDSVVDVTVKTDISEVNYEDQFELEKPVEESFQLNVTYEAIKFLLNVDHVIEISQEYKFIKMIFEIDGLNGAIFATADDEGDE